MLASGYTRIDSGSGGAQGVRVEAADPHLRLVRIIGGEPRERVLNDRQRGGLARSDGGGDLRGGKSGEIGHPALLKASIGAPGASDWPCAM